jgi:hypothetical protein
MAFTIARGIELGKNRFEDVILHDVPEVACYHLDRDRDEDLGYALSQYNLNYVFDAPDKRDFLYSSTLLKDIDPVGLPASVDMRSTWETIMDQGTLGSCVANSVSYQLRHVAKKMGFATVEYDSRLFIYYNGRMLAGYPINQDTGLTIRNGFQAVAAYGSLPESEYPYVISKFAVKPLQGIYDRARPMKAIQYFSVTGNVNELKKCLKDGYVISFGMTLFSSFMSYTVARTGRVPVPNESSEQRSGGHAMTIIGYNDADATFIVANSWGRAWGDKGFCFIPYGYMLNRDLTGDFWTLRFAPTLHPPAPAPVPVPLPVPTPAPTPTPSPGTLQWAPSIRYKKGEVASYLGVSYRCTYSHTSMNIWNPPAVPALWKRL